MISHKYKLIFIHIPKCAGTSIEYALGHRDGIKSGRNLQDHRTIRDIEPINYKNVLSIEMYKEIYRRNKRYFIKYANPKNRLTVNRQQYDDYLKFTIVRNPWDRVLSIYRNIMRDDMHKANCGIKEDISLKEFIEKYKAIKLMRPQLHWITNSKSELPLNNIIKFENLEEEFKEVCDRLSIFDIKLPHRLKTGKVDYQKIYDSDSKKLVNEYYKEEIDLFKYEF